MHRLAPALVFLSALCIAQAIRSASAVDVNWSGVYIGGNVGTANARATADYSVLGVPAFSGAEDFKGFAYGGQLGVNAQTGRLVLGVEADIQATNLKASRTSVCATLVCGLLAINVNSEDRIPWLATFRGRAGFAFNRILAYGTAGVAYGAFESRQTLTTLLGSVTAPVTDQRLAWALGAGAEIQIVSNWSAKLEYLYIDTGKFTTNYTLAGIGAITETDRLTVHFLRAGVNYRF